MAFGVVLLTAGAAFAVYAAPLGARAKRRGARYGRDFYYVIAAFLLAFGATELVRSL